MNRTFQKLSYLIVAVLVLLLAACVPQGQVMPETGAEETPEPQATLAEATPAAPQEIDGVDDLVEALRAAGAEVEPAGEVQQPFFPVEGQVIRVNGMDVQVFEFADEATRQQVSETISATGDQIGTSIPTWVADPHFWAEGRLIVLYVGEDQAVIDPLNEVLGEPIAQPGEPQAGLPPRAALEAQQALADQLGIPAEQVEIVSSEQVEWPDACLGIEQPGVACAEVITPGWRVMLQAEGEMYEAHTDELGETVLFTEEIGGPADGTATPTPAEGVVQVYLVALEDQGQAGQEIGCGDSLVPVEVQVDSTDDPVRAALEQLLSIDETFYGESGLYNALADSELQVESVEVAGGVATVRLTGDYQLGGVCDNPRFEQQLRQTVLQFPDVDEAMIYLNGTPLEEALSLRGEPPSFSYEGITFRYSPALAERIDAETVPATPAGDQAPSWMRIPEHFRFTLEGYPHTETLLEPQLMVFPIADFRQANPEAAEVIDDLTMLLTDPSVTGEGTAHLPLLPLFNAVQIVHAKEARLEFQNGGGIRFLTQVAQGQGPVNNEELFYTFQGLTEDGNYYVSAVFPVSHPDLPDTAQEPGADEAMEGDFDAYLQRMKTQLGDEPASSFVPELTALDELIQSLSIDTE